MTIVYNLEKTMTGAQILNKIGISLLQKDCYRQALATFQEAISVIDNDHDRDFDVETLIDQANARLEAPEPFPRKVVIKHASLSVKDVSEGDNVEAVLEALQGDASDEGSLTLQFDTNIPRRIALNLALAIIQYNNAVAYSAFAKGLSRQRRIDAAGVKRQLALNLLKMSDGELTHFTQVPMEADILRKVFFVHMVVLLGLHKHEVGSSRESMVIDKLYHLHAHLSNNLDALAAMEETDIKKETIRKESMAKGARLHSLFRTATSKRNLDCSCHSNDTWLSY